ncbi:MAG: ABC transporter permease [Clostridiales bacterium]|nr:ABC transporter permease [Clostridiales bacterium]
MRTIYLLVLNTLKVTFRKKSNYIVYFALPILGLVMSMTMHAGTGTNKLSIGIINMDNGILSNDIINSLSKTESFEVVQIDSDSIDELLMDDKLSCAVIFPKNLLEGFLSGNPKKIEIVSVRGKETTIWLENYIKLYTDNIYMLARASGGKRAVFDKLYEGYKNQKVHLEIAKVDDQANDKSIVFTSLGFLIMFVMIGTGNTAEIILKDKRNRTYFRICSAPVKPGEYVLSNAITNIIIVLIQICLLIFIMRWVFKINTYVPDWQMVVILGCFGLVAISIGMMIVALARSSYEAGVASTLVITPSCMLAGCFWPVEYMPAIMQKISYFIPQRWALDAVQALQRGAVFHDVAGNLVVLMAFAAVFFVLSAYRFSTTDDVSRFI